MRICNLVSNPSTPYLLLTVLGLLEINHAPDLEPYTSMETEVKRMAIRGKQEREGERWRLKE
jgi:hypothetical protein